MQAFKQEERTSQGQDMAQQPFSYMQAKGGPILPPGLCFLQCAGPREASTLLLLPESLALATYFEVLQGKLV